MNTTNTNNNNNNTNTNTSNNNKTNTTTTSPTTAAPARVVPSSGGGCTATGAQACAVCKYRRRKCAPDCMLAPFFPPNQQKQFLNAHKLFGVSNMERALKKVQPAEQEKAMKCLTFHANVRAHDPVGGCFRIIRDLERQIDESNAELELVLHQLAAFRQNPNPNPNLAYSMNLQATDCNFYGRLLNANPIQEQEPLYDMDFGLCKPLGIKVKMDGYSSSSVLMDGKQVSVDSDDIKPLIGNCDAKDRFRSTA